VIARIIPLSIGRDQRKTFELNKENMKTKISNNREERKRMAEQLVKTCTKKYVKFKTPKKRVLRNQKTKKGA